MNVPPVRPAVLEVSDLNKSFEKGTKVLNGVSFAIRQEESVALIGSNGSGKSTLMRCCMHLLKFDSGTIKLMGEDITTVKHRALRKKRGNVGFVFQQHNLVPRLSVLTNVLHGMLYDAGGPSSWFQCFAKDEDRSRALDCLDRVGLAHLAGRRADGLSGGQSQRVAIARALMQKPTVIIADEPVASLDPKSGEEVMQLFSQLMHEEKITLLFTSHKLDQAIHYSDRILGLQGGRIAIDEKSEAVSVEELRKIYK